MDNEQSNNHQEHFQCKLCGQLFAFDDMSDEHYPARSVGNDDIVSFDIVKLMDSLMSDEYRRKTLERMQHGETPEEIYQKDFDTVFSKPKYPKGRTARTLCRECNTFLGKYDEAYLKFFNNDGDPKVIKGYSPKTKIQIIKSIFGKFLSVPEAAEESFDFIDFLRNEECTEYNGAWKLYFIKRNLTTDLLGYADIRTGKAEYDEGVVYEFSDEKFIFNLMNFDKHSCFEMTDIFDVTKKSFSIVEGANDPTGGYHGQILLGSLLSTLRDNSAYDDAES